MKRRDFLRSSAIGLAVPSSLMKADTLKINKNNPVICSTWNFGLPANELALKVLDNGGNALDAAEAGARHAESDPENNSVGFGGLPDEKGNVTLDACVMDSTGNAGSVAFLQNIKHPVSVARKVMEETKHVMLVGEGARQFAVSNGFEEINLLTEQSEKDWKKWLKER
ncbi:MAG: isoaspartyl peptidase/L-asparaginase, partial [Candidatus Marinimicrobia bacterium]|nr:isoaspartyl peptidase/L-asparaginase [Candidatus Neomarinimicrobiota bacterium]